MRAGQAEPGPLATTNPDERRRPPPRAPGIDPDQSKGWIKRAFPLLKAHRGVFMAAFAASLVTVVAMVLFPLWLGTAIDEALAAPSGQRDSLARFVWILVAITVVGVVAAYFSRYLTLRMAYSLEFDLRTLLYRHLSTLSASFFDRVRTGELVSRANSDVRAVQMLLAFGPMLIVQFGMFFLALYFMLTIDVGLTLVALLSLPAVFVIGLTMRKHMFPVSWLVQSRLAEIATIVDENVSGAQVVRVFGAERRQIGVLARAAQRLRWASMRLVRIRATFGPLMQNVVRVGEAAVLLYGGFRVLDGAIGPGDIIVFLTYLVMLQAPFAMLGLLMMLAQRAAASAHRIYEVLDERPEIADRPGAFDLPVCRGEVELRDVRFSFGSDQRVLDGVTLRVPAGHTVAFVGATGSGKTTIAQLIPRFYDVDRGAVLLDGHDVRDLTLRSLRQHVGVCFEEPFLFSASIRDNIAYGTPGASDDDVVAAAKVAGAHEFITQLAFGYTTVVGERGYTLSGGQRQRIAIARTVLVNPPILILDDATSAIDVQTEQRIHDGLRQLMHGRTTLIVAHRLSTLSLADRVVLLEGGRIAATGTHQELLTTEPRYAAALAHVTDEERIRAAQLERERTVTPDVEWRPIDPDHLDEEEML
ncbi:ABC transporter ATP-binding protein [Haloechinothrix salitolerans]|uniref:ABC transporter ATP-binding protein n=1 Tax=Haloechinothrix salitolerans TaxID=926830 RepID=A0ABW2C9J3_9PSEU